FSFGLIYVEHIHGPETVQIALSLIGIGVLFCALFFVALVADHWSENENAFFAPSDEAAKRSPSAEPGDVGGIWPLPRDEHDVAEASCHRPDYVNSPLRACSPFP